MKNYYKYNEIKEHCIDVLNECKGCDVMGEDIHHKAGNEDYYIIGYYETKVWLSDEVFNVIEIIKDYELDNFGEVNTNFSSSEEVVNMYVYVLSELILSESATLSDNYDNVLTDKIIDKIIEELN